MRLTDQLITLANLYASGHGLKRTAVSWRIFADSRKLQAIIDGKDLVTSRYEQAMQFMSDDWPSGVSWPSSIQRPAPVKADAA